MTPNGTQLHSETPFLEAFTWQDPAGAGRPPEARLESPFTAAWSHEAQFEGVDVTAEVLRSTLAELHDAEFDEALYELANEAALTASRVQGSPEALLEAWVEPLRSEADRLFENLSTTFARTQVGALSDAQLETMMNEAAQPSRPLEPVFEQFFGSLLKKARSMVKSVANVAKKGIALAQKLSPVHLLLGKLKALVKPLIRKVLQLAMNRLPALVRPAATQLARHLLGGNLLEAEAVTETETAPDVGGLQREFDERVVNLMFTPEDASRELMLLEASTEAENAASQGEANTLDAARTALVNGLSTAAPGEVGPVVHQFIPAILPALRLGLRLIGRPRVVSTIAGMVTKLIGRFVGPEAAPALSRALVDTGLKLLSLESAEHEVQAGPLALAATVEDVVRRVSEAEEAVLDDSRLLEAEVTEAFARSAAAHFPPHLVKPEHRESSTARGTWALFPQGRFKKFTRIFEVELTPEVARSLQTFGGGTLEGELRDRRGLTLPQRARVHLYEGISGTWLSRLARAEKNVAGLGPQARGGWKLFYPLTKHNAAILLREPGLGRDVSGSFTASGRRLAVGQRLFFLEIPGAPSQSTGRPSRLDVTADFPRNQLRVGVFVSEREAQGFSARLSSGNGLPSVLSALKALVTAGLQSALSGRFHGRVRLIHEAVDHQGFLGGALNRLAGVVLAKFTEKASGWVLTGLADALQKQAGAFTTAAQNPADGVTLHVTLDAPPGFGVLRAALKGKGYSLTELGASFDGTPTATVAISPGFVR